MAYNGSQHFRIARPIVQPDSDNTETISGHKTLTDKSSTYQFLDNTSGVTLDCILPSLVPGMSFWIMNEGAANNITVMEDGVVIETLTPGQVCKVRGRASGWKVLFKA